MDFDTVSGRLAEKFAALSPQLQQAARHVLDRPDDVALLSMRKLAQVAQVHPSTMVRLARSLDFPGFSAFREPFRERLRSGRGGYQARVRDLQAWRREKVDVLLRETFDAAAANLEGSLAANDAAKLTACADIFGKAQRVFVLGLRGCYPVAFFFHYAYRMFRPDVTLLDGRGGTFADELRGISKDDAVFAAGYAPYTRNSIKAVQYAAAQGAATVVLTDSSVSPLVEHATIALIVNNDSPSFFQSFGAAMTLAEALIVILAARGGKSALAALGESEEQLAAFDAYWHQSPQPPRRP